MSGRNLRRRLRVDAASVRNSPFSQPSPYARRRTPPIRRSVKYSKPHRIMKRCQSEPMLLSCNGAGVSDDQESSSLGSDQGDPGGGVGLLYRPQTSVDLFSSASSLPGISTGNLGGVQSYNKDAKVVVNVTVEGSPGPIRTMVKLGCCVEEAIKLVLEKYSDELRTPKIDKSSPSSYELHLSYFSLQCLDKSESIWDTGSRSFYLRRIDRSNVNRNRESSSLATDIAPARTSSPPAIQPPIILTWAFIGRKFCKLLRRTGRLLKLLVCLQ